MISRPRAIGSKRTKKSWKNPAQAPTLKDFLLSSGCVNDSGKVGAEMRYFLARPPSDPRGLAQTVRRPGSIKNHRHEMLEVTFRENDSRMRDPTAVRHFALLRKMAIHRIGQDR